MKIALLEDDPEQSQRISGILRGEGHECSAFGDGSVLIRQLKRDTFDLLLLDWRTPGVTGYEVTAWARANLSVHVPIVFLTSRALEVDIVAGLTAGADDYMVKPIRGAELLARITALQRRINLESAQADRLIIAGNYRIDPTSRCCYLRDEPVELTCKEFDLTLLLFQHIGRVLSREHIGGAIWGHGPESISRTLDTHMSRIRIKLELRSENGVKLTPVYGQGYRLDAVADLPPDADVPKE